MSTKLEKSMPAAIMLIPAVAIDVLLLVLLFPKAGPGWISLVLLNLGFLAIVGSFRLATRQAGNIFGYALSRIALSYVVVQLAITLIVLGITSFEHWLGHRMALFLAIELVVTAVFGGVYAGALLVQRRAGAELAYQKENLAFGRVAAMRLDRIRSLSTDPEFVVEFRRTDDAIRFSVVDWVPAAKQLEAQIIEGLEQTQASLESADTPGAIQKLVSVRRLADERSDAIRSAQQ